MGIQYHDGKKVYTTVNNSVWNIPCLNVGPDSPLLVLLWKLVDVIDVVVSATVTGLVVVVAHGPNIGCLVCDV